MRYLPTLEVRDKMIQVALPDLHGVALAEAALMTGDLRRQKLESILLDSPMLLYWGIEKFNEELLLKRVDSNQLGVLPKDYSFEFAAQDVARRVVEIVASNCRDLVQDHARNLTSIERLEPSHFLDFHTFFVIKQANAPEFASDLTARLLVMTRLFGERSYFKLRRGGDFSSVDEESLYREYQQSDFSISDQRGLTLEGWNQELPFFRGGLAELDQRLERVEKLELDFDKEVEKAKLAAMRQLAYGASHEVNNPLANISTRAQALLRDETDPKRRQRLQTIDAQAFRAHDMISNLMTFARPPSPVFSRFQLLPVVQKALDSLQLAAQAQQTEIEIEVESAIYFVADQNQVSEMVFALVQNSLEAIRQGGKVRIKAMVPQPDQPISIAVIDDGPGISPEIREHIFDPFFSGREAGRGLGFGLSKVWRLMELHQGQVEIADLNGLTCIRLVFPQNLAENSKLSIGMTA